MPLVLDLLEAFATCAGEFVITSTAIVLRGLPLGFDKTVRLESAQGGVKRAFLDAELVLRCV